MAFPSPGGFLFNDLRGRTLVLTGLTRGIGRAFLPYLLEQGVHIIGVSRGLDKMEALRTELGATPEQLALYECDLADPSSVAATGRAILESGTPIDGILNNAAIDPRHWFEKADEAFWLHVTQVNLFAAVALTRQLLPRIRESKHGRILFTGSVISELGGACLTAYSASKGALLGVTRSLAHELQGTNITVNCVIPGAIQVEKEGGGSDENLQEKLISWQSVPRRLVPADLIALTSLLLSEWGGGITGQSITVDGGIVHPLASPTMQGRSLEPL